MYSFFQMRTVLEKLKNPIWKVNYSICDDCDVNTNEPCINSDWFCMSSSDVFSDGAKSRERYPSDSLTWWIITQCKGYTKKGIGNSSKSVPVSQ